MKIDIENLKAQMQGIELNIYQKADALIEFNKLLDYVEDLEQCNIDNVVGLSEQCAHPRDKREYIGSNMLRCKVCGKEFS